MSLPCTKGIIAVASTAAAVALAAFWYMKTRGNDEAQQPGESEGHEQQQQQPAFVVRSRGATHPTTTNDVDSEESTGNKHMAQEETGKDNDEKPSGTSIRMIHFNDVYHISPVASGGYVPQFKKAISEVQDVSLVVFSGDVFNPSTESVITRGHHMVPVLNSLGIDVACYGNHDFDFGEEELVSLTSECNFPWLISNLLIKGEAPEGAHQKIVMERNGFKIGFFGIAEPAWLDIFPHPPEGVEVRDPCDTARKFVAELKEDACDLIICISHMRWPNDVKLAKEVSGIDAVLGGHDHFYRKEFIEGTLVIKSGSDFENFSVVDFTMGEDGEVSVSVERHDIDPDGPEDEVMKTLVTELSAELYGDTDKVIAKTETPLDATNEGVRTRESNLGDLVCGMMRARYGADICICAGGTFRSNQMIDAGDITIRDVLDVFPFSDPCVVVQLKGKYIHEILENGVSKYPAHEGRFPQVSGLRFSFDPEKPSGDRVVKVTIGPDEVPLDMEKEYTVATRQFMAGGGDGYTAFKKGEYVVDEEEGSLIGTIIRVVFRQVDVINTWKRRFTLMSNALHAFRGTHECKRTSHIIIAPEVDGRIEIIGQKDERLANVKHRGSLCDIGNYSSKKLTKALNEMAASKDKVTPLPDDSTPDELETLADSRGMNESEGATGDPSGAVQRAVDSVKEESGADIDEKHNLIAKEANTPEPEQEATKVEPEKKATKVEHENKDNVPATSSKSKKRRRKKKTKTQKS